MSNPPMDMYCERLRSGCSSLADTKFLRTSSILGDSTDKLVRQSDTLSLRAAMISTHFVVKSYNNSLVPTLKRTHLG